MIFKQNPSCSIQKIKYHLVTENNTNQKFNLKESTTKKFYKIKSQKAKILKNKFTSWNKKLFILTSSMKNLRNSLKNFKNKSTARIKSANKIKTELKNSI
jgi:hypothetical protein